MKTIAAFVLVAIMTATAAMAGSIEDLQYKDNALFWDLTRTTNDYNVNIDADTVGGKNVSELGTTVNNYDGGGVSVGDLGDILFGDIWFFHKFDFIEYLKTIFATKDDLYQTQAACMHPGADQWDIDNYAALIKADETGNPQQLPGRICHPGADRCVVQ